eukprot:CAMPEP_0117758978 /NCGR_PEP_ID=MMETSP0947-20121206/15727_1 /TAXON_ID=44440 /ORGANISM="Chattonella subsalsa, Strain CCMP2191" /LENGTH=100 /DNA_ID=CAMNT_0005579323 /DNA_START=147 /DNA_END=445 /DNA_ORIENTATION=-
MSSTLDQSSTTYFTLPMADDTQIKFKFDRKTCKEIANKVNTCISSFKKIKEARAFGQTPEKQEIMMVTAKVDLSTFEFECNPNIYPDLFKALVFVKVSTP